MDSDSRLLVDSIGTGLTLFFLVSERKTVKYSAVCRYREITLRLHGTSANHCRYGYWHTYLQQNIEDVIFNIFIHKCTLRPFVILSHMPLSFTLACYLNYLIILSSPNCVFTGWLLPCTKWCCAIPCFSQLRQERLPYAWHVARHLLFVTVRVWLLK